VRFNDESIKSEVHGLLAERSYKISFPAYVAGVAYNGNIREPATQFDGNMPLGKISVDAFIVCTESPVNDTYFTYSGIVDAFYGTDPQFKVGIDGVFDKDRNVHAFQCIGYLLHRERIRSGTGTYPENIHAVFECFEYMVLVGYLGRDIHARFFLHTFQPGQSDTAYALEPTRFGTGFPYSGTEYFDTLCSQLFGGFEYLVFGLGAAWTGDDERTFVFDTRQGNRFQIHNCVCHRIGIFYCYYILMWFLIRLRDSSKAILSAQSEMRT